MNENQTNQEEKEGILVVEKFNWLVPECCREGWDSCPHVVKKKRKARKNIGL